jgi:hypothetical protein
MGGAIPLRGRGYIGGKWKPHVYFLDGRAFDFGSFVGKVLFSGYWWTCVDMSRSARSLVTRNPAFGKDTVTRVPPSARPCPGLGAPGARRALPANLPGSSLDHAGNAEDEQRAMPGSSRTSARRMCRLCPGYSAAVAGSIATEARPHGGTLAARNDPERPGRPSYARTRCTLRFCKT